MEQKIDEFSMKEAMKLANSDWGKSLYAMLQENHKTEMGTIQSLLAAGDIDGATSAIRKLMACQDTNKILRNGGGKIHG